MSSPDPKSVVGLPAAVDPVAARDAIVRLTQLGLSSGYTPLQAHRRVQELLGQLARAWGLPPASEGLPEPQSDTEVV